MTNLQTTATACWLVSRPAPTSQTSPHSSADPTLQRKSPPSDCACLLAFPTCPEPAATHRRRPAFCSGQCPRSGGRKAFPPAVLHPRGGRAARARPRGSPRRPPPLPAAGPAPARERRLGAARGLRPARGVRWRGGGEPGA